MPKSSKLKSQKKRVKVKDLATKKSVSKKGMKQVKGGYCLEQGKGSYCLGQERYQDPTAPATTTKKTGSS